MQANKPILVADAMRGNRDNAFNLLRLAAAMLVFFSHESLTAGSPVVLPGYFGVYVFFIISGFLIARSWDRRSSAVQYFGNRGLRILPGLWAVVLITTFVIGPLATNLPLSEYFSDSLTWRYLLNLLFDLQRTLPGVFHANPSHVVNVPLWTLTHEAIFYVAVAVLGLMFRQHVRYVVLSLYLIVLLQNDASLLKGHVSTDIPTNLIIYFFGGSLIWYFREYIAFNNGLLALAVAALFMQVNLQLDSLLWSLSLPYVVLWLGLRKPPAVFGHFGRNDYSYGFYVWGMVCQQCVVAFAGISGLWSHAVLASAATALCAYCSWHLLEKRALQLKNLPVLRSRHPLAPAPAYLALDQGAASAPAPADRQSRIASSVIP